MDFLCETLKKYIFKCFVFFYSMEVNSNQQLIGYQVEM